MQKLSKKEIAGIDKLVRSPLFNQRQDVIAFWGYLEERLYWIDEIPTKESAAAYLFPDQPYDAQRIRYLMSWLLKLVEQYLALEPHLIPSAQRQIELASAYREKRLPKHFRQTIRKARKGIDAQPLRHVEYYQWQYQVQWEHYLFSANQKRVSSLNLQEVSDTTDIAFMAQKLRQTCFLLSHQAVYKAEYDFGLLREVLAYAKQRNLLSLPAIGVYYHCYYALSPDGTEKDFQAFKDHLLRHWARFPESETKDLLLLGLNYCIRKFNAGGLEFAREGLDLYQKGLSSGVLLSDGFLSRFTYRNAVALAVAIGALDWAASFIEDYKKHLPKEYQESMYSFSRARLAYEREQYGEVLQLLQRANYKDLLLNLAAKSLLQKTLYVTGAWEALESQLDAMTSFLARKDILSYHRNNYHNFAILLKKILVLNPHDPSAREALRVRIEGTQPLTEKYWLLEQLAKA